MRPVILRFGLIVFAMLLSFSFFAETLPCKALKARPQIPGATLPILLQTANASGGVPLLKLWAVPLLIRKLLLGRLGLR